MGSGFQEQLSWAPRETALEMSGRAADIWGLGCGTRMSVSKVAQSLGRWQQPLCLPRGPLHSGLEFFHTVMAALPQHE